MQITSYWLIKTFPLPVSSPGAQLVYCRLWTTSLNCMSGVSFRFPLWPVPPLEVSISPNGMTVFQSAKLEL